MIPFAQIGAADQMLVTNFVQGVNGATTTAAAQSNTFTASVTAGNLLVAVLCYDNSNAPVFSSAISTQNTGKWVHPVAKIATTDGQDIDFIYCENCNGGPETVTVTLSAIASFYAVTLLEATGIARQNSFDKTAQASGSAAGSFSSGFIEPTTYGQYLIGVSYSSNAATPGGGWTSRATDPDNAKICDQVLTNSKSVDYNATMSSSSWGAFIASFKAAGQGAV